jgi:hypothetical protein
MQRAPNDAIKINISAVFATLGLVKKALGVPLVRSASTLGLKSPILRHIKVRRSCNFYANQRPSLGTIRHAVGATSFDTLSNALIGYCVVPAGLAARRLHRRRSEI